MDYKTIKDNPALAGISKEKLDMLSSMLQASEKLTPEALIPFFIKSASDANKQGMSLSDAETNLILDAMKTKMSSSDIKKIDTIKKLANMINNKSKRN